MLEERLRRHRVVVVGRPVTVDRGHDDRPPAAVDRHRHRRSRIVVGPYTAVATGSGHRRRRPNQRTSTGRAADVDETGMRQEAAVVAGTAQARRSRIGPGQHEPAVGGPGDAAQPAMAGETVDAVFVLPSV